MKLPYLFFNLHKQVSRINFTFCGSVEGKRLEGEKDGRMGESFSVQSSNPILPTFQSSTEEADGKIRTTESYAR